MEFFHFPTEDCVGISENSREQQASIYFHPLFHNAPSLLPNLHPRNLHLPPPIPRPPPRVRRARRRHARRGAPRLARVPRRRHLAPAHARPLRPPLLPPLPRRRRLRRPRHRLRRPGQARRPPWQQLEAPRGHCRLRLRRPHGLRPGATCPRRRSFHLAAVDSDPRSGNRIGPRGVSHDGAESFPRRFRNRRSGRVGSY